MPNKAKVLSLLIICLLGCSPANTQSPPTVEKTRQLPKPESPLQMNLGQTLPISAQATMAGRVIKLEVARSAEEQAIGLMYRTSLADDRGMLFIFQPPQPVAFWMKNTLIPLDMVFLRDGVVQGIRADVPPCTSDPCPSYGPANITIDQVIELRGGRAAEIGLKVGDRVDIKFLNENKNSSTPLQR